MRLIKLTLFFTITFCISLTTYAFCPFTDFFTISTINLSPAPKSEIKFLSVNKSSFDKSKISGQIPDSSDMAILQDVCGDSFDDWNPTTFQVKLGEDEENNYCEIDIKDGALMSNPETSRINCVGDLKDKAVNFIHTPFTFNYKFSITNKS